MKLQALSIEFPSIFFEVLEKVKRCAKNKDTNPTAILAGGCLSDYYMSKTCDWWSERFDNGYEFRDIDVFATWNLDYEMVQREFGLTSVPSVYEDADYSPETEICGLLRFQYKGHTVEIVLVEHLRRIYDFDFRFRQFFLYDDTAYASENALLDIKEKRLNLVNPYSARSTLVRSVVFQERYGFEMDETSRNFLFSYFNFLEFRSEKVLSYIQNHHKLNSEQKNKLCSFIQLHTVEREKHSRNIYEDNNTIQVVCIPCEEVIDPSLRHCLYYYLNTNNFNCRFDAGFLGVHQQDILNPKKVVFPANFRFTIPHATIDECVLKLEEFRKQALVLFKLLRFKLLSTLRRKRYELMKRLLTTPVTKENYHLFISCKDEIRNFVDNFYEIAEFQEELKSFEINYISKFSEMIFSSTEFHVAFERDTDTRRMADCFLGNTFILKLTPAAPIGTSLTFQSSIRLLFRKCKNGKFTLSSSFDLYENSPVLKPLLEYLQEHYPSFIELYNPLLEGEFHLFSVRKEHFFSNKDDLKKRKKLYSSSLSIEEIKTPVYMSLALNNIKS